MSITTQVVWTNGTPTQEGKRSLNRQINLLKSQGVTDGNFTQTPVAEGLMIHRNWTTVEAANNWITFVSQYNPLSANIVS